MHSRIIKPFLWLAVFILIVGLACSFGGKNTPEPQPTAEKQQPVAANETTQTETPTEEPVITSTPEGNTGGAISNLQDAKNAVIQIEAQGTFINPDFSVSYNAAGLGSGFIIDPSGLAVTNNHVVTGAGLLKVWIGGDKTKTYNAKVLGVSECSDLAVIDIDGDNFPYLDWHEGPINVGLEVYAAGYPLGEPEFTLTKGIVSKERADGESSWASVDYVLEHDATINPGNSGGPLLDANGNVVGINYASRESSSQYYAIGRDLAEDVIDQLKSGKDLETFGVNGEAFLTDNFSGIWVYSVKSGSLADKAGLTGGDIITTLEDLVLATDGTKADYCDILRSHNSGDTLNIEILRWATQEVLQGQINGRELAQVATFGDTLQENVDQGGDTNVNNSGAYTDYVTVTDDYDSIQLDIPAEWTDVNGSYWQDGEDTIGAAISASANLDNFNNSWTESGVFFGASDDLAKLGGYVQLLDIERQYFTGDCKLDGRYDYEDALYRGRYDLFTNCANTGNAFIVLSAVPNDNSQAYLILVQMQITKDADFDALQKILDSFQVVGVLP